MKSVAENTITSPGRTAAAQLEESLRNAWLFFRSGDFVRAEFEAEKALMVDFEDPRVVATLKCAVFWKDRIVRIAEIKVPEKKGDFLLRELSGFESRFLLHLDCPLDEGVDALRQYVYQSAAKAFLDQIPFDDEEAKPQLLLKCARAHKGNGDFDQALSRLEEALVLQKDSSAALAEMADCFEMTNETQKAKLFFREAFYLGAQSIDLSSLRSVMVGEVVASLSVWGYKEEELVEWVPVHAVIQGAFNVKRELKPLELGHLKQSINTLKTEIQAKSPQKSLLIPRLINRYFWLIDHFLSVKEERSKVEDVLLNIKLLDPRVHELYTQ
jgi:tetratricopeptide (TPR) repeat protein